MDVVVRAAVAADGPACRSLSADAPADRLDALRARSSARVLVAEHGGGLIGLLALQARDTVASGRVAQIETMATIDGDPATEAALLLAAEQSAAELGCRSIVESGPDGARHGVRAGGDLVERFVRAACAAAEDVVGALVDLRSVPDVGVGADGAATKAADRVAEQLAVARLAPLGVPICSEEGGHIGGVPSSSGTWIAMDPVDGTRNYLRSLPPYGFAAALVSDGRPDAGVVVDLTSGRRWIARRGRGATVDGRPCRPRPGGPVAVPSVSPAEPLPPVPDGHSRVRMSGSTTIDLCRVADGSVGAFVDLRRAVVHVHDLAAPLAVLTEAGVPVADADGGMPRLEPDPRWVTHLLAGDDAVGLADVAPPREFTSPSA